MAAANAPAMQLDRKGIPVSVVVRVRPVLKGELSAGFGLRINSNKLTLEKHGTRESKTFGTDYVFGPDSETKELFDRSVLPLIQSLVDGINVSVFLLGGRGSGKKFTFEGTRDGSKLGLLAMSVDAIATLLREKEEHLVGKKKRARAFKSRQRVRYCEIFNEQVSDLLDPANANLEVIDTDDRGPAVQKLSSRWIESRENAMDLLYEGRASRSTHATDFGPATEKATYVFSLELTQTIASDTDTSEVLSTLTFYLLPVADVLAEDPTALRLREGPTANRSLLSFGNLVRSLADPATVDFANYSESKLAQLLVEDLGGNAVSLVLACVRSDMFDASANTLSWAEKCTALRSFPVVNDGRVRGLLRRYRLQIMRMREELNNDPTRLGGLGGGGGGGGGGLGDSEESLMKIHRLEGRIIKDNLEKIKLKEDREKVLEKLGELTRKYEELVESKAAMQADLIASEEEKLRVSKALIDLQIQNNALGEDAETKNFELVNKVLSLENDLLELQMRNQTLEKMLQDAKDAVDGANQEKHELQIEFVALKANFVTATSEHKREVQKNQELGLELLNVVNASRAHETEIGRLQKRVEELLGMQGDSESLLRAQKDERARLEAELRELREKSEVLRAELVKQQVELEQQMLELESKKVGVERQAVDAAKSREEELAGLRRAREADVKKAELDRAKLDEQISVLHRDLNRSTRKVRDVQEELADAQREKKALEYEKDALQTKLDQEREAFRKRLKQCMTDISNLSKAVGRADDVAASKVASEPSSRRQSKRDRRSKRRTAGGDSRSSSSDGAGAGGATDRRAFANLQAQQNMDAVIRELVESYVAKENDMSERMNELKQRNKTLIRKHQALQLAYRSMRNQVEDSGVKGIELPNERELLLNDRDAKTDVEHELEAEILSLTTRAEKLEEALQKQHEQNLTEMEAHQRLVLELQSRNADVISELESLRILKRTLEEQGTMQLDDLHATLEDRLGKLAQSQAATGSERDELARLRHEAEDLRAQLKSEATRATELEQRLSKGLDSVAAKAGGDPRLFDELKRLVREFILNTQSKLERERSEYLARATMAEEQLAQMQVQMRRAVAHYQSQIQQLRSQLAASAGE